MTKEKKQFTAFMMSLVLLLTFITSPVIASAVENDVEKDNPSYGNMYETNFTSPAALTVDLDIEPFSTVMYGALARAQSFFGRSSFNYNHELATFAMGLSAKAYGASYRNVFEHLSCTTYGFGMPYWAFRVFNYADRNDGSGASPEHRVGYTFSTTRTMVNGEARFLTVVTIRATHGREWHSNFEVGLAGDHFGFRSAEALVRQDLLEYMTWLQTESYYAPVIGSLGNDIGRNIIVITGHSRGAAVANLLGANLNNSQAIALRQNIFTYTFATPNTTRNVNPNAHQNIFNIINAEDFVAYMPLSMPGWDFGRHGITFAFPSRGVVSDRDWAIHRANVIAKIQGDPLFGNPFFLPHFLTNGASSTIAMAREMHRLANNVTEYYTRIRIADLGIFWFMTPYEFMQELVAPAAQNDVGATATLGAISLMYFTSSYRRIARDFIRQGIFNLDFVNSSPHHHYLYLAWMNAIGAHHLQRNVIINSLRISSPVDVMVLNNNNQLVARIVNDEIDDSIDYEDIYIVIDVYYNVKYIYFSSFNNYTVRLIGNDYGTMSLNFENIDLLSVRTTAESSFSNIELYPGREFVSQITNAAMVRLFLVEDNEIIGEIGQDGKLIPTVPPIADGTGQQQVSSDNGEDTVNRPTNAQNPRIRTQPESITVYINNPAHLSVTANITDRGTLSFQWYRAEGQLGGNFRAIGGATERSHSPDTSAAGINRYRVIVTNTNTSAGIDGNQISRTRSRTATITVIQQVANLYDTEEIYEEEGYSQENIQEDVLDADPALLLRFSIDSDIYLHNGVLRQADAHIFIDPAHERTMVPLRVVAEALNAYVTWENETRTVIIEQNGISLRLQVDTPLPGGMGMPIIANSRTFVPLAYISEMLGANVRWDTENRAVYVSRGSWRAGALDAFHGAR